MEIMFTIKNGGIFQTIWKLMFTMFTNCTDADMSLTHRKHLFNII